MKGQTLPPLPTLMTSKHYYSIAFYGLSLWESEKNCDSSVYFVLSETACHDIDLAGGWIMSGHFRKKTLIKTEKRKKIFSVSMALCLILFNRFQNMQFLDSWHSFDVFASPNSLRSIIKGLDICPMEFGGERFGFCKVMQMLSMDS